MNMEIISKGERALATSPKNLLIDGKWIPAKSGKTFATINPTNGKILAEIAYGDKEDIDLAVASSRRAFEGEWSRTSPFDRQAILLKLADLVDKHFDEIAYLDTMDMGAPLSRTTLGRRRSVALLRYYAGLATSVTGQTIPNSVPGNPLSYTLREPIGVVGAINPWNGPFGLSVWKLAPAIAAGCTVVLKPAEQAPLSPLFLGQLCLDAGLPPGVVNVVPGTPSAGAALSAHPDVDKIAFTGSTEVGQKIIQASAGNIKRLSLELGGKSPNIVFADADLDKAVPGAAMAVFQNNGQVCSAGTRLYIEEKIYDEFVEKVANFTKGLRVGDPLAVDTDLGPLVSSEQYDRVTEYMSVGAAQGAIVSTGGEAYSDGPRSEGYFVKPTVFSGVNDDMRIAKEEIFGPVISAMPFTEINDVLRRANNTPFGLGSGVWTRDINKAQYMSRGLKAGSVWINCYQFMDPAVPFGGYKMSGNGRESGMEHMEEFLETKSVWINTPDMGEPTDSSGGPAFGSR